MKFGVFFRVLGVVEKYMPFVFMIYCASDGGLLWKLMCVSGFNLDRLVIEK